MVEYFTRRSDVLYVILGLEIILILGLMKLVRAVAHHSCLNMPPTFRQRRENDMSEPSNKYFANNLKLPPSKKFNPLGFSRDLRKIKFNCILKRGETMAEAS